MALVGFDQVSAEVFVNLVTGQSLPDAGRVAVLGRLTSDIVDSAAWLQLMERFGLMSERAVLVEPLSALQNLAMPYTLSVDPMDEDVRVRAEALAREIGLIEDHWKAAAGSLDPVSRMRLRFGRAIALGPSILLLEHVSAGLAARQSDALARDIGDVSHRRGIALVVLTADEAFAKRIATRVLRWEAASGRLSERRGWFGGRVG